MKAYALTTADQPAALVDLPDPEVPAGGALIRVRAASVNGMDVHQAAGYLTAMMPHDFPVVIGRDFAGVIEAVGAGRTDVAVGDEVLGFIPPTPPLHVGAWAQLIPAGPDVPLARKPAGLSFEVAATIPLAGATALDAVHAVDLREGDTVVVAGATGGVGSFVVQFASHHGATVIATAKAGDEEAYVRALGASETVDYAEGSPADALRARFPEGIDVLIDLVNRDPAAFAAMASLVRDGGRLATTMGAADVEALAARGVHGTNLMAQPTAEKLAEVAEHVDEGTVRAEVQRTFPLDQAAAATAAFAAGTVGKLVLTVG
jgi:NADPH2:quinone reductase